MHNVKVYALWRIWKPRRQKIRNFDTGHIIGVQFKWALRLSLSLSVLIAEEGYSDVLVEGKPSSYANNASIGTKYEASSYAYDGGKYGFYFNLN